MSRDIRAHSASMVRSRASLSSGFALMAAMPERRTASGERSSWEAEAMNSACFCLLSSTGRRDHPTNFQLIRKRPAMPNTYMRPRYRIVSLNICMTGGM